MFLKDLEVISFGKLLFQSSFAVGQSLLRRSSWRRAQLAPTFKCGGSISKTGRVMIRLSTHPRGPLISSDFENFENFACDGLVGLTTRSVITAGGETTSPRPYGSAGLAQSMMIISSVPGPFDMRFFKISSWSVLVGIVLSVPGLFDSGLFSSVPTGPFG